MTRAHATQTALRLKEPPCAEMAQARVAALGELEASLQASQAALLARDVAVIEQSTNEQVRLQQALEGLWSRDGIGVPESDPALGGELRSAQRRVLHLVRTQAALLRRAQCWLRTLSNMLAGPEAIYLPLSCHPAGPSAKLLPGNIHQEKENKEEEGELWQV
jgi:hypothetical protein